MRRRQTVSNKALWSPRPGLFPLTPQTLALADQAMQLLWQERQAERGVAITQDRSGSCKFAALLARELFGGEIAGNFEHVFVLREGNVLDLNAGQADAQAMGERAHEVWPESLFRREYTEALASCMPRVERWTSWVARACLDAESLAAQQVEPAHLPERDEQRDYSFQPIAYET